VIEKPEDAAMKSAKRLPKILGYIRKNPLNALIIAGFAVAIIKLFGLYNSADTDDGRWQQFRNEHRCVQQHGEEGSQRLSWKCDDGKTYFSWRQQR